MGGLNFYAHNVSMDDLPGQVSAENLSPDMLKKDSSQRVRSADDTTRGQPTRPVWIRK